jgi:hypothetical protein
MSIDQVFSRWVAYDFEFQDDGRKVSKIVFMLYSPDDNADNAERFVISCNKDLVKSKLPGCNLDMQVNKWDDLLEENIIAKCKI